MVEINNQRGHPPKNNNKARVKLSEAILSILGDFWEKFKCSPRPTSSKSDGRVPVSKVHLQPATWLTGKFPSRRMSRHYCLVWVWSESKIKPFGEGGGGGGRGFWQIAHTTFKSPQTPWIVYFPATISFQGHINFPISPGQQKFVWGTDILSSRSIGYPWINEGVLVISVFRTVLLPRTLLSFHGYKTPEFCCSLKCKVHSTFWVCWQNTTGNNVSVVGYSNGSLRETSSYWVSSSDVLYMCNVFLLYRM